MSETRITPADLEAILRLVEAAEHLGDFHLKYGDLELRVSRSVGGLGEAMQSTTASGSSKPPAAVLPAAPAGATSPKPQAHAPVEADMAVVVKAPMVGTFYRAPSPGAPPFVEIGDKVQADTVVCIIEVMKLMNTIHAGVAGTVREIRVENSQAVEFGQVLIVIEPER
jgi:acetyl-CoA carboxylase biotin carboxyl carrier protein